MSEDIYESKDSEVIVTRFSGGVTRGICYQINAPNGDYIELTNAHFREMIDALATHFKLKGVTHG